MLTSFLVISLVNLFRLAASVSTTDGRQCVFPFIYEGREYNSCTLDGADTGLLWCSVTSNYDNDGLWGYCGEDVDPGDPDFSNCPLTADVTIIIEPFTSFSNDDWFTTSTFLKRFIDNFPISLTNTRMAFMSTDMQETFYLNKYYDRDSMKAYIDGWLKPQTSTSLAGLFDKVSNTIYTRDNGDRADVENVVIVIVNGQGNTDQSNEASVRAFLLQQKAQMYVVGVTQPGADLAKSLIKDQSRVSTASSFRDLNTVVFPRVINSLCGDENNQGGGGATPRPTPACSELEVTDISPNSGSVLGGTLVTIVGCQLAVGAEVPTIKLGEAHCQINSLSATVIVCTTSINTNAASEVVELKIQPTPSVEYKTGRYFNYAYNNEALITEIVPTPPKTMVSGSVAITVNGQNFPGGGIKLVLTVKTSLIAGLVLQSTCRTVNTTQFVCRTPDLNALVPQTSRRRRSLAKYLKDMSSHLVDGAKRRQKRQIRNARIDSPGFFEVFLGVTMTGNNKYIELGRLHPLATKLQVYEDPNIFSFGGVQKFRPFPPINQKAIKIKGERLDQGVRAEDYQIAVGNAFCKVVKLSYSELECEPPQEQDPPDAETVSVFMLVGPINFSPGEVRYQRNQWEDMGFRAGIGFFIFGFIVIVIIIWVIVACVLQKRIDKAGKNDAPPPPRQEKAKKNGILKAKKPKQKKNVRIPQERVETPSQESELSESRMNTGVSVDGYDHRDWAY